MTGAYFHPDHPDAHGPLNVTPEREALIERLAAQSRAKQQDRFEIAALEYRAIPASEIKVGDTYANWGGTVTRVQIGPIEDDEYDERFMRPLDGEVSIQCGPDTGWKGSADRKLVIGRRSWANDPTGDLIQHYVDGICHYRNLAIDLGADPDFMLNAHDRKLCVDGLSDMGPGYWSQQDTYDECRDLWSLVFKLQELFQQWDKA